MISPDDDEVSQYTSRWKRSIIFYVKGYEPTIEVVYSFIAFTWNNIAKPNVYWHDSGYFVIHCQTEEDCAVILSQGPYQMSK